MSEFNELGFEAVQRLVIALESQLRLSGVRITPSYKLKIKKLNFYLDKEHFFLKKGSIKKITRKYVSSASLKM